MKREIAIDGHFDSVMLIRQGDRATLVVAGRQQGFHLQAVGRHEYRLTLDGKSHRVWMATDQDRVWLHAFGRAWELTVADPLERARLASGAHDNRVLAPMPGAVVSVAVAVGERVHKGQALLIIESMKMQTELLASCNGSVETIAVTAGDTFDRGACLVTLTAEA